jgi:hypothetical protein
MQRKNWADKYSLCVNCINCKLKGLKIKCSQGYFSDIPIKKIVLLTPHEFDCWEYEEVD